MDLLRAKLNWKMVETIRKEFTGKRGEIKKLAVKYGISALQMQRICRGTSWKNGSYINRYDIFKAQRQDWQVVPGFPRYLINSLGEIWFLGKQIPAGRWLKPKLVNSTALRDAQGNTRYPPRARLVLLAFRGPPPEEHYHARHLDDVQSNNDLANLAWGTAKDNHDDGVRNGKHFIKGTPEAKRYAAALKGKSRPKEFGEKISHTKRAHPERQYYYKGARSPLGQFLRLPK